IDLLVYFVVLFVLTKHFGIGGAAMAWAGRTTLELLIFLALNHRFLPKGVLPLKLTTIGLIGALGVFYSVTQMHGIAIRTAFAALALVAFSAPSTFWVLEVKARVSLPRLASHRRLSSCTQRP